MKLKSILLNLLLLSFLLSCSNQKKEDPQEDKKAEISSELQKNISLDSIQPVALSEQAKTHTADWMMYIALHSEVKRFENYTLMDVVNNSETIEGVVDSLSVTVPKTFDTNAVKARIVTLKTHAKLLKENAERSEPNPSEIKELSAKLKLDFNNLNIQLNEVFIIEESTVESDTNNS